MRNPKVKAGLSNSKRARARRESATKFPDKAAVLEAVARRHANGQEMNADSVMSSDRLLFNAARRLVSRCWYDVLTEAGLSAEAHRRKGPKITDAALVLAWVRGRYEGGLSLRQVDAEKCGRWFNAAKSLFGSWGNALEQAGLDPRQFVRSRKVHAPEDEIRSTLQRMIVEAGEPLTQERLRQAKWSLLSDAKYWAAKHAKLPDGKCARWSHVLTWLNVPGNYHQRRDARRHQGSLFESLAQIAWQKAFPRTKEHRAFDVVRGGTTKRVVPDRSCGKKLFIEFRLAATHNAVHSAIDRYRGVCKSLVIVYLEGRYTGDLPPWVTVRSIFDFEEQLKLAGVADIVEKLYALRRGERPYVPDRWATDRLMYLLRRTPKKHRQSATSIRQYFMKAHGQTATKRLDKVRGTFAASCYAEGLIADPGPGKRLHIPKKYRPAVLYHYIHARQAAGLTVTEPATFYKGPRPLKRLYEYASDTYGGWYGSLDAVSKMVVPPSLPGKYHLAFV